VGASQIAALHEGPEDNDCTAEGDEEPEQDCFPDLPAEKPTHEYAQCYRGQDLGYAADDGYSADSSQRFEGELDAQGEHQQDYADGGQGLNVLLILDKCQPVGSDHNPAHEVAEDDGQTQPAHEHAGNEGDAEHNGHAREQAQILHPLLSL